MTGGRDIISPLGCREVDEPVPDLDLDLHLQDEAVSGGRKEGRRCKASAFNDLFLVLHYSVYYSVISIFSQFSVLKQGQARSSESLGGREQR